MSRSSDERRRKSRVRRWKRAARIAAPFLAIPLLLGLLVLSVGLLEGSPAPAPVRLRDRPIARPVDRVQPGRSPRTSVSSVSVIDPELRRVVEAEPGTRSPESGRMALGSGLPGPERARRTGVRSAPPPR